MNYLKDIISDIESENCVLVLGPDLQDYDGNSFFKALCLELNSDNKFNHLIDLSPQHIFVHEELLQLKPLAKETTLLRFTERFYKKQIQLEKPLKDISQIPFHLIISLMPDLRLKNIFEEQNISFQYGHYPREENPKPVEKPTKEKPLIYNLLGDFNEGDVVFTFDHLFTYLSGIMGKRELPQVLQESLKKARTFIFLGVHFEKWYFQLLLRIITSKQKKDKYTLLKNADSNAVSTFVARRLELDFIEKEPLVFLNQLYNECGNQSILRTVNTKFTARVFISYSHLDNKIVDRIEQCLIDEKIEVIRDHKSMSSGQKIEDFIDTIKNVDCVLSIISENSLLSTWVSRETIITIQQTSKYYLPCYLDESFMDKLFISKVAGLVDEKLNQIGVNIIERGTSPIDDLLSERTAWSDFNSNFPFILSELTKRKCVSLMEYDFERNIYQVIQDICYQH